MNSSKYQTDNVFFFTQIKKDYIKKQNRTTWKNLKPNISVTQNP